MSEEVFVYVVDSNDVIMRVSDNWHPFALANDWCSEDVVGHKLWVFIKDFETCHLYQELFRRARAGKNSRPIPFRCDSPCERRFLELLIESLPDGLIKITSTILRTEHRSPVSLLEANIPRSASLLMICSMCKKIKVAQDQWVEVEAGLASLKIFEHDQMPQLSHGLCPACYQAAIKELDDVETHNN